MAGGEVEQARIEAEELRPLRLELSVEDRDVVDAWFKDEWM